MKLLNLTPADQHVTRAYNSLHIDKKRGILFKISEDEQLKQEINYYQSLDVDSSIFFPRFLGSEISEDGSYIMKLEYYGYDNLGDYMVYSAFDPHFGISIVHHLNSILYEFSKHVKQGDYTKYAQAMYIDKTEKYYNDLVRNFDKFSQISKYNTLVFNEKKYLNFECIWDDTKKMIEKELYPLNKMSVVHGDFCFSNILCGGNKKTDTHILKCIDPRGKFGELGIYGDALYDSAKLLHSYEGGYEYIIFDEFYLEKNLALNNFTLRFSNNNKDKIRDIFDQHSNVDLEKAKIIEGLLFISMCSRHYDGEQRQLAMYNQGIKFLNEALEQGG